MSFGNPQSVETKAGQESRDALNILVKEVSKRWYQKPEGWFAFVAAVAGSIGVLLQVIK